MTRLSIEECRKKYPRISSKDSYGITVGEIVERLGKALDADASHESQNEIAAEILDRDFLFGAWGYIWTERDYDLLRDIRGVIVAAYRAGKAGRGE